MLTIVGLVVVIIILGLVFLKINKEKKKLCPSMPTIEVIYDEYATRFLFTVLPNNPAGSKILLKPLRVERVKSNQWRKRKEVYFISFQENAHFLSPDRDNSRVPDWFLKGKRTFVALLKNSGISKSGKYKLTFYTSDGSCSNTVNYVQMLLENSTN